MSWLLILSVAGGLASAGQFSSWGECELAGRQAQVQLWNTATSRTMPQFSCVQEGGSDAEDFGIDDYGNVGAW